MCGRNNIIERLRMQIALAAQESQRGVILQPGALGDCVLTLPLAEFMKETVCPGGVDIIGHTEYTGIFPGRSCVDSAKSMESVELHRLFADKKEFDLSDGDPLVFAFAGYSWIVTFLGGPDSDFEQNLIFTANCSHSAEVMGLEIKPAMGYGKHISNFYKEQFIEQSGLSLERQELVINTSLIRPSQADLNKGMEILAELGVMPLVQPVIIHPGSGGKHKCWHLDNYLSVAETLRQEEIETVFLLGPAEAERFDASALEKIRSAGKVLSNLPLAEVLSVLSCGRGFVGNDSGITHLAAVIGMETVAVFGPTEAKIYGPTGSAVTILQSRDSNFSSGISEELQGQVVSALLK